MEGGSVGTASREKAFLVGSWRKYWIGLAPGEVIPGKGGLRRDRTASWTRRGHVRTASSGSRLQAVPESEEGTGLQEALQPAGA